MERAMEMTASPSTQGKPPSYGHIDAVHAARTLCGRDFIRTLMLLRAGRVVLATAVLWVQLLGAWVVVLTQDGIWVLPAFVVICACVSGLQLWVHESSHYTLFRDRRLNDLWAVVFFASPIGMSLKTYRRYHLTHHAHLGTPRDMDRFAFNVDVRGARGLGRMLLRGLSGYEGLSILAAKYFGGRSPSAERDWSLAVTAGWNLLLLAACVMTGRWYLYFLLWAYPILAVAVTINTIRSVGEHQPADASGPVSATEDILPIVRTTAPNFVEKWLMFQANFNYHFEHHLYPSIPATNLPRLYRHLEAAGFYERHPFLHQASAVGRVLALSSGARREPRPA